MPVARRRAETTWQGSAAEGSGELTLTTSKAAGPFPVSLSRRAEDSDTTQTNPEELIAAAHSTCYAMAFSNYLSSQGTPPDSLDVKARVTLDEAGEGFAITESALTVTGSVPGYDQEKFAAAAEEAHKACPVSNVLRNNAELPLEATLS